MTQGVAAVGKLPEAMAWAIEMAEYGTGVAGTQISLGVNAYGDFGGMAFLTVVPDMATADAVAEKVRSDQGYLERVTKAAGLVAEGTTRQSLLRRIA